MSSNPNTPDAIAVPLRFVIGQGYGDGCLCCPVCGGEYVHIGPVNVAQGQTNAVIENEQITVKPCERGKHFRGSLVQVVFWCECGHEFTYSFQFHKGITSCSLESRSNDRFDSLWRD